MPRQTRDTTIAATRSHAGCTSPCYRAGWARRPSRPVERPARSLAVTRAGTGPGPIPGRRQGQADGSACAVAGADNEKIRARQRNTPHKPPWCPPPDHTAASTTTALRGVRLRADTCQAPGPRIPSTQQEHKRLNIPKHCAGRSSSPGPAGPRGGRPGRARAAFPSHRWGASTLTGPAPAVARAGHITEAGPAA